MNDPWNVKSIRESGQYQSCMKICGVPLLPPVLSKECRQEMQYYKHLAKEVEKRISLLQNIFSDSESEDTTDASELPECEQVYEQSQELVHPNLDTHIERRKIAAPSIKETSVRSKIPIEIVEIPKETEAKGMDSAGPMSPTGLVDYDLTLDNTKMSLNSSSPKQSPPESIAQNFQTSLNNTWSLVEDTKPDEDIPERDYNCIKRISKKVLTEKEIMTIESKKPNKKNLHDDTKSPLPYIPLNQDGPSSLSTKSFTGSLNDLQSECIKDSLKENCELSRQRSYTLLHPSPQLLAHLEFQSQNTGVEMKSISMSESLSNMYTPSKKRRSWDLESAKMKWSNMALELSKKGVPVKSAETKNMKSTTHFAPRSKSVLASTSKRVINKPVSKNETLPKTKRQWNQNNHDQMEHRPLKSVHSPTKVKEKVVEPVEVLEPAARVRELYENVQKQQLVQMASLVEKQKKEQLLLQQVFEEQNHLLYEQLKTICPKSPIQAKEAWGDKHCEGDRGPVSLSQLINYKSPGQSTLNSPVTSALADTNHYINHCDDILKKSRDISSSLKKPNKASHHNNNKIPTRDNNGNRSVSPIPRNLTSRKLCYDTSDSSDREDPMFTGRSNDTMADLNVTFPSDSDGLTTLVKHNTSLASYMDAEAKTRYGMNTNAMYSARNTENAIRSMERTIQSSITNSRTKSPKGQKLKRNATPEEVTFVTKISYKY